MENTFLTYTLIVSANMEKRAVANIKSTIEKNNLDSWFGDVIFPIKEVPIMKNGKASIRIIKLLPNYLLIEMDPKIPPTAIRMIIETNKVQGFVGGDSFTPTAISEDEKNNILNINNKKENPQNDFNINDNVRIQEGPFMDFEGIVDSINGSKVKVNVSIFGRTTPVEIHSSELVLFS